MSYLLTVLYVVMYYIRPFEWNAGSQEYTLLPAIGGTAFVFVIISMMNKGYRVSENYSDTMMVGFMTSILVSHIVHLWFGGGWEAMMKFLPVFIGYFIIAHSLDTETKMEWFITILIACTVALAIAGIVQFHTDSPVAGAKILLQKEINNFGIVTSEVRRIRWHGTFADPNDLAIAFVLVIPYLMYLAHKKRYVITVLSIPLILYGIYLTNSRGASIAVIVAISAYFIMRKGTIKGMIVALIVVVLIAMVGPSRIGTISAGEESAYGRLQAWYEGFQILIMNPVFGSGVGTFTEYHEYTAHNSFVLVFAEMGLVGAFFFTGIFFIPIAEAFSKLNNNNENNGSISEKNKLVIASLASLVGVLVTMLFLSRSYTLLPYLAAGMVLASVKISDTYTKTKKKVIPFSKYVKNILVVEFGTIIFLNIVLKILL